MKKIILLFIITFAVIILTMFRLISGNTITAEPNEELIYGLAGINIILFLTCVVLQFKVFRLNKEANDLLKRNSKQARQNDALVKQAQKFWN